jgi:prepilin-type processing-associated H-X9-DG protein
LHNYLDSTNVFPSSRMNNCFSAHTAILPFMEQTQVYNSINFGIYDPSGATWIDPPQSTAAATTINSYLCPSDPQTYPIPVGWAGNNYRANEGTSLAYGYGPQTDPSGVNTNMPAPNGVFFADVCYGIQAITDGTSNTGAFSEHLTGSFSNAIASPENTFNPGTFPSTALAAIADCNAINIYNLSYIGWSNVGAPWIWGKHSTTVYYHSSLPGSRSCAFPPNRIMTTADSVHPGGVNLLMADGSVRFVKNSINLQTWWALGTRNGGEVVSSDSY